MAIGSALAMSLVTTAFAAGAPQAEHYEPNDGDRTSRSDLHHLVPLVPDYSH
jgi:hypothetical protein